MLLALLVSCAGAGPRSSLSDSADSLRSQAAEGAILAAEAASGASTQTFTREHAADLLGLASRVRSSLQGIQVDPPLNSELGRLNVLADRVEADLARLGGPVRDLRALSVDLQAAADEGRSIGESLS